MTESGLRVDQTMSRSAMALNHIGSVTIVMTPFVTRHLLVLGGQMTRRRIARAAKQRHGTSCVPRSDL